ncbi:HAD-IA family hydrolase [Ferruginivarius sediminum]|uniref:HAD family hydrolase n=1 Tax=Ferruginivarius sediminum TaxID=2661937 RepID=A0A369T8L3_9PROT|nr:HAD-IA family hydrolase [Ferruginivarius sediminum]RDD61661.1 HAD family hydrolase [Ferruginivarius sediminum]
MAEEHPFKLIVFDVDGTLVDSQAGIVASMTAAFDGAKLPLPSPESVRRVVGLSLDEAVARLMPDGAGAALVAQVADAYRHNFIAMRKRPDYEEPLFPGARETIAALDLPQVCLGVATGKNMRGLRVTLDRHDLARHFVTLQTADGGPGKPHPRMLHEAMADVGAEPHETVIIGDTVFDMEMAANAGTAALGVAWGYHEREELLAAGARHVLTAFDELPRTLTGWGEATACGA